jgi:hypothetical protein
MWCLKKVKNRKDALKRREETKVREENDAIESFIWYEKWKNDTCTQLHAKL